MRFELFTRSGHGYKFRGEVQAPDSLTAARVWFEGHVYTTSVFVRPAGSRDAMFAHNNPKLRR